MADYPLIQSGKTKSVIDTSLGELNDVNVENASHQQVLTYIDGAAPDSRWQPTTVLRDNWLQANNRLDFLVPPSAPGTNSIALGNAAVSSLSGSLSIGDTAVSNGIYAVAVGYYATGQGNNSTAVGRFAKSVGTSSIAIAAGNTAANTFTIANADNSIAVGSGAVSDDSENKIIFLTDDAGIRVKNDGIVQTTSDGGVTWSNLSSSESFAPQPDEDDRFDVSTDIGAIVYFDGVIWKKASANDPFTIGTAVIDWIGANKDYTIKNSGIVHNISPAVNGGFPLVPGDYYYLSSTSPGQITNVEPDQDGEFVVPVYMAISTNSAMIVPFRANLIGSTIPVAQVSDNKMLFRNFKANPNSSNPENFKVVYSDGVWLAHSDKELSRSTDNGNTWTTVQNFTNVRTDQTYDLESNGKGKWIITQKHFANNLLVSYDDGRTWTSRSFNGLTSNMKEIVCDRSKSQDPTWILYGTDSHTHFKKSVPQSYFISTDDGNTWSQPSDLIFENVISNGNGTWVASENNNIYFSEDNAQSFEKVLNVNTTDINDFAGCKIASNKKGTVICAVQGNRVHVSRDWGKSWTSLGSNGFNVSGFDGNVDILISDGDKLWYSSGSSSSNDSNGVAVSIDGGASWYPGPTGLNITNTNEGVSTAGYFGGDRFIVGRSLSQCARTLLP